MRIKMDDTLQNRIEKFPLEVIAGAIIDLNNTLDNKLEALLQSEKVIAGLLAEINTTQAGTGATLKDVFAAISDIGQRKN